MSYHVYHSAFICAFSELSLCSKAAVTSIRSWRSGAATWHRCDGTIDGTAWHSPWG